MWKKTTEERYNAGLDHMIPTAMTDCGFLVGEPDDHAERQPRYAAFVKINGEFFESTAPITINEFDSLKISDVMAAGPEGHEQPSHAEASHVAERHRNDRFGEWELDTGGRRVSLDVEAGEKFPQNFRLEVTNPGGHSSRPVKRTP